MPYVLKKPRQNFFHDLCPLYALGGLTWPLIWPLDPYRALQNVKAAYRALLEPYSFL